jgi:proteasome lid subunit RPN8/RPN11
VTIPRRVLDGVLAHARDEDPLECCGILLGAGQRIVSAVRARNIADDPSHRFLLDPADHIAALRSAREHGLVVVGFYHSHPHSPARPSPTDIAEATYAGAVSLIVGVQNAAFEARVFRLGGSPVEEVALEVED